ncbi:MAG: hypothetical protein Q8S73_28970 [Deltaproteobacteria bacterium]|nr:hypothetical protein [Myxococcales bacterium]MDP3218173.1 hypothetical protein [Deltaproteobacteria bacterium]
MKRALALLLLSLACATRMAPPSARRVRRPPRIARTAPAPSRLLVRQGIAHSVEVFPRDGDVRRVILDGRPLELREGQPARFGRGRLVEEVTFAAPAPGGRWRFVTGDGLWEADGFLGALRLVAAVGSGAPGLGVGRAITVRNGEAADLRPPDDGVLIDAAFVDDVLGVAVSEPGLAWTTRDGGAHWTRVTVEGVALSVVAGRDGRWLRTTRGTWAVDEHGVASAADDRRMPRVEPLDGSEVNALQEQYRDALARPQPLAVASTDGSVVLALRGQTTGLYDLRDESWSPLPALPPGCGSTPEWLFAGRLHARCGRDLYALGADGRWSLRLRVAPCGAQTPRCFASDDGERVTCPGRCSADAACVSSDVWCELAEGAPPRERRGDDVLTAWHPVGYVGHALVGVERRSFLDRMRVTVGDGAPRLLLGDAPEGLLRADPASVVVGPDGMVRMSAWVAGSDVRGVLEGPPGGRFAWRTLPDGEPVRLALLGDRVTVAATSEAHAIVLSRGPGRPWEPLRADPAEPMAASLLGGALSVWAGAGDAGWSSAPTLLLGGGGPVRLAATSGLFAPSAPRAGTAPAWRCEIASEAAWADPRRRADDLDWTQWVGIRRRRQRVALFDDVADLAASPFPVVELAASAALPSAGPLHRDDDWALATLEPTRATLLRVAVGEATVVEAWALGASPSSRPIGSVPLTGRFRFARIGSVARSAERAAVVFSLVDDATGRIGPPWLADLRRDGALSVAQISGEGGAFVLDDAAGFARVRADGRVVGGAAGSSPRVLAERVTSEPCSATARGDVRLGTAVSIGSGSLRETAGGSARYALDGDALCLRSIASAPPGGWVIAREGAGWGARSSVRGNLVAHRCTPTPPDAQGRPPAP